MGSGTNGIPGAATVVPFTNRTSAPCGPRRPAFFSWRDFKDWVVSVLGSHTVELSAKADKVSGGTTGNLAGIGDNGSLVDSGLRADGLQPLLVFDGTPTAGSLNPVTSDGIKQAIDAATPSDYAEVKAQVAANTGDIAEIESLIPAQASAQNQLADRNFVNSSIQTNTATFRGTYNLVSDLGLTVSATEQQVAAAIAAKLASLVPPVVPENNDYVFVQVPKTDAEPTVIERVDRYKCTVTESGGVTTRVWDYEWSLNNSSFTADQWAAINSGITSELVTKLGALPTASELAALLLAKYEKPSSGIPKTDLSAGVQSLLDKADSALQEAPVTSVNGKTGAVTLTASDVGAATSAQGAKADSAIQSVNVNGTALTPDASKAVDVTVPTKLNDVCPNVENWLGVPGTTSAGKSIKVLAKTVNGVIEGGITVTGSSNNDNNTTKYRYGGVTVTRNGVATEYLLDDSQSGVARLGDLAPLAPIESPEFTGSPTAPTPPTGDDSTKVATAAFVQREKLYKKIKPWNGATPPGGNTVSYYELYSLSTQTATLNVANADTFTDGRVLDFIVYVNVTASPSATINFGGLGSDWYAVVNDGEDLTDMTTLAGDEIAMFCFTQTPLMKDGKPVMWITKQVVTEVGSGGGSYQIETDGTVTTEGELNNDGTFTVEGELNTDGTLTVNAL